MRLLNPLTAFATVLLVLLLLLLLVMNVVLPFELFSFQTRDVVVCVGVVDCDWLP